MRLNPTLNAATMLSAAVATLALAGCGGPSASNVPAASVTPTDPTAEAAQAQAEADRAALQAREDELAKREAELALAAREQELARREAELAAKERAPKKVAATPKPVPAKAVAVPASKPTVVAKPAPVPVQPILIPAGTELSIGLSSAVSTKSASIGDPVDARLASDLVVGGCRAIMAGEGTGPYNLGSDECVSINELARRIAGVAGKRISIRHESGPLGVRGRTADCSAVTRATGWTQQHDLLETLAHTYPWVAAQVAAARAEAGQL